MFSGVKDRFRLAHKAVVMCLFTSSFYLLAKRPRLEIKLISFVLFETRLFFVEYFSPRLFDIHAMGEGGGYVKEIKTFCPKANRVYAY
jgi:hypothetical protein